VLRAALAALVGVVSVYGTSSVSGSKLEWVFGTQHGAVLDAELFIHGARVTAAEGQNAHRAFVQTLGTDAVWPD
jgi:hypothetical protein